MINKLRKQLSDAQLRRARAHDAWDRPAFDAAVAEIREIITQIGREQDKCEHQWYYMGRYAGDDGYRCTRCGTVKTE